MSSIRFEDDEVPEFVTRMEKVPAPYHGPGLSYTVEGLSSAMIAWFLDINVRASIKRREFDRTRIRICLYIKHMERIMTLNHIPFEPYTGKEGGEMVRLARKSFKKHLVATTVDHGPVLITGPIYSKHELCRSVSDAQSFEFKLHQLEVIRSQGRADPPALDHFISSKRPHRPETMPRH